MKEKYLEVQKFPNAELRVARSTLQLPKDGETSGDATGTLTLHGQTRNVPFHYVAKPEGDTWKVRGTTRIDMKQFGIEVPSYLGVTVQKDVDISVRFETRDE
jgi:polyisoprenoid-binding protein YceI